MKSDKARIVMRGLELQKMSNELSCSGFRTTCDEVDRTAFTTLTPFYARCRSHCVLDIVYCRVPDVVSDVIIGMGGVDDNKCG
jgi:hypothetical protein